MHVESDRLLDAVKARGAIAKYSIWGIWIGWGICTHQSK